jgi:hypothetical protein
MLTTLLLFSVVAGCGKKNADNPNGGDIIGTDSGGGSEIKDAYTLNEYTEASPANWSPHSWKSEGDNYIMLYCETPLVDATIADDGVNSNGSMKRRQILPILRPTSLKRKNTA